ncbi:PLC-like phosphodiesterase, partial [Neoconidiobolus thromboides FSU 785]
MGAVTSAPVEESSPPRSNRKKWMEELSKRKPEFNKLKLHQMALPGTHNSATYHIEHKYNYTSELARCQQHDVLTQLNSGVRVLDLRICDDCSEGVLKISHRFHGVNLGEVLHQIYTFLSDNQGEIVLVNIKKDFDRELSEEGIKKASEMIKNYFGSMIIDNFKVYEFGYEELIYKKLRIHFFS